MSAKLKGSKRSSTGDREQERDAHAKLDAALRRQKTLAEFSLFALREPNPLRVIGRAATLVAEALQVDFGTVLELEADGKALRVVAGHNWPQHRLGTHISAGGDTQAGHALELSRRNAAETLEAPQPVAIEDLRTDGRFVNTFRVRELGVVSSVCVVVPTAEGPYGVLAAHCRARRRFEPVESEFMQAAANVLSAALAHFREPAALRESEARFRSLAELSSDWYWEQDENLRFSYVSRASETKAGRQVAVALGKLRWELDYDNLDEPKWIEHRKTLEARRPFRDFEVRKRNPDGTAIYSSLSGEPIFDEQGRFRGYRGIGRDITAAKQAEHALAESEARKGAILDASIDAVVTMNHLGRIVEFNAAAERHFGYSRDYAIGKEMAELIIPSELREAHRKGLARFIATGEGPVIGTRIEVPALRADGSRFDAELAIVRIAGSEPPLFTGTARDITARKAAERLLGLEHAVTRCLASAETASAALRGVMRAICESQNWECGRYFHHDQAGGVMRFQESWCDGGEAMQRFNDASRGITFAPGVGLVGHAWQAREPLWVADVDSDPRVAQAALAREAGVHGALVLPVIFEGRTIGVLSISSRTVRAPDQQLLQTLHGIGNQLGQFLQRKQAEQALRQSMYVLENTFEYMDQGISITDADLRVIGMNRRFRELLDFPESLCKPSTPFAAFIRYNAERGDYGPGDAEEQVRTRVELARRFEPHRFERERPDGTILEIRGGPVPSGGFVTVYTNVTQRARAERALRESEARFRSLTELTSDWYWEQDDQFRFTTLSGPGAAAMSRGGDPSIYLGKARWEISDLEHVEGDWSRHRAQLERHEPFRDLILGRRMNDGTLRYMNVSGEPVVDEAGGFKGYRGVASDVTDTVVLERSLRESEQRFLSFMDNVPANAFIKDSQLRYTWINRAHELYRNDGLHDVLGRDDFQLRPLEVARSLRQQDEEVLRATGPVWFVNRIPVMDGREAHFLVVKFPLPDASGAPGVAGIGIDISEQYKLEQTVRQLLRRLVHTQEAERRKVAGDLHDLIGQKLTALSLGLDIVRQLIPDAAAGPLDLRLQQMSALLEETIAAVRNVMSELRPPMLDDHGLLPALHWYASLFEARTALRVRVAGPELGPRLDREIEIALFRIAQEALTNAAKHSGGSRVRIQVERFAEHVRMCIEDDGRGFDERALERAAGPTSWGMSAMRERAHAFGGQLRVESRAPGAAIVVDVPLEHAG